MCSSDLKLVRESSHHPDRETNAPEERGDYDTDDRILPDQTDKCRDRVEDHERKDEQGDTPENPSVPNSQLDSRVEI